MVKPVIDDLASRAQQLEESFYSDAKILRGFPRLLQLDSYTCAVQSSCMILRYFRKSAPIHEIEEELGTTEEGTSWKRLRKLFCDRNLKVESVSRCYPKKLRQAIDSKSPILISVDGDHCAVVYGYCEKNGETMFFVADPALNRTAASAHTSARFRSRWDRTGLIVSKKNLQQTKRLGAKRIKKAKK